MHIPVLLKEVIEALRPEPGKKFVDATANGGGHTTAMRQMGAEVLPIEWDPILAKRIGAVNDNYANIAQIARENGFDQCDGVLFDLGFSSEQLEMGRGFSFMKDEPLDMRYNPSTGLGQTAADILNKWSEEEIAGILKEYGEERFDGRIASAIVRTRPIYTTFQLVEIIQSVVPASRQGGPRRGRIHPATRTFQALRIAVNHELENLQKGLEGAIEVVKEGGKVLVISFHSLEDRIVKRFFRKSKVIKPGWEEIKTNKRARSAKLRVVERTAPTT